MARFWKEFKYSLRMRKHIFFLLMVIMGLVSAVYLFRESLQSSLEKAFPNEYGIVTESKVRALHIEGSYAEHATAKDVDIQAELTINRSLHEAAWMDYEEGFLYDLYVKDYTGPNEAVIGYDPDEEKDKSAANKAVEMDKGKYGKVHSAWLSPEIFQKADLSELTARMFSKSSTYTDNLYVMMGAGMQTGKYEPGTELTLRVEGVKVKATLIGFFEPGTTLLVGNHPVCLDFYVVCPLLDLSNLYDPNAVLEALPSNTDSIYLPESLIKDEFGNKDTEASEPSVDYEKTHYTAAKCLWLTDEDIDALDEIPSWLQSLRKITASGTSMPAWFGHNYADEKVGVRKGSNFNVMMSSVSKAIIICHGYVPEGETFQIGDKTINLDEYIVVGIKKKETASSGDNKKDGKEGDGEDETESGLQVEQRTLLFRLLVKKNSGLIATKYTADEAQQKFQSILESSWENYQKDNPDLERTSSYVIREADKPGSVIYRDKIRDIPGKMKKYDTIGYIVCVGLLLLYLVYKFLKGSDYYTTLVLTGDTKFEIILLFLAELLVLFVFACGLAFGLSWAVCKLLGLREVAVQPIISKNLRIIAIPFVVVAGLVIAKDFGKIFRRR